MRSPWRWPRMNVRAIVLCRDEVDVVPEFLAHIDAAFDGGMLVDHRSTDGSAELLWEWSRSRPSWTFGQLDSDRFRQATVSNVLIYEAFEHGADAVMCIDVDEFIAGDLAQFHRNITALGEDRAFGFLTWRPACPRDPTSPSARLGHGLVVGDPQEHRKIVIPRWAWDRYGRTIGLNQGNHSVLGVIEPPLRQVGELLHIPIRSTAQLRRKVALAMANYTPKPPTHIALLAELLNSQVLDRETLQSLALSYGHADDMRAALRGGKANSSRERLVVDHAFESSSAGGSPGRLTALPEVAMRDTGDIILDDGRRLATEHPKDGAAPKGVGRAGARDPDADIADTPYSDTFFLAHLDGSLRSALEVLRRVLGILPVNSMLDIGCGTGAWLRVAGDLGVRNLVGVDGPYIQQEQLVCAPQAFHALDLKEHRLRLRDDDPHAFDLVCSMEVAEHLPPDRAASFVEDLCAFGDTVLFSAAIPNQGGTDHVNEQWPTYWARLFADLEFDCFDLLRPKIWSLNGVEWWYRQNALLFARRGAHPHHQLSTRVPPGEPLCLVHPGKLENAREELVGSLAAKDLTIQSLETALDEERRGREEAQAALATVLSSRSWRLTAPLRRG